MNTKEQRLLLSAAQASEPLPPKVGMIVLSTDQTCEQDFGRLRQCYIDQGLATFDYYVNRLEFHNPIIKENLCAMLPEISNSVAKILPEQSLDAVVFNCTSASALLGDDVIINAIHKVQPQSCVLTTAQASVQHILASGYRKVSLLTPYNASVSRCLADYFQDNGLQVISLNYLDIEDDQAVARLDEWQIIEAAKAATANNADALFISCTATRAASILTKIEAETAKPCFSSNHSTFVQTLCALGLN